LLPGGGLLDLCSLMPSPQPSPTGEGENTKNGNPGLPFCFYLEAATRLFYTHRLIFIPLRYSQSFFIL